MKLLFSILFIASFHYSIAQSLAFIDSISIGNPTTVSMDRAGYLYFADSKGELHKYNPEGRVVLDFSPPTPAKISLMEAWQGLRIFIFYQDLQEYIYLDRFLVQQGGFSFNPNFVGFVEMATPSFDNNIWLIDQTDFSLKKYNIQLKMIPSKTEFDLLLDPDNYSIHCIKEYQNKVYISDYNSGILVFDNMGSYLTKIARSGIGYFNFWDDTALYIVDNKLFMLNIYAMTEEVIQLPNHHTWQFALMYEDIVYLLADGYLGKYQKK